MLTPLRSLLVVAGMVVMWGACAGDDDPLGAIDTDPGGRDIDLAGIPYSPLPYVFELPEYMPRLVQPEDNLATEAGVRLGRMLFFDPILSVDSTVSCGTCHEPERAFTDGKAFSLGVSGSPTRRSSMSLVNVAFQESFFWDGRSGSLEEQSLHPVEDPTEMGEDWDNVLRKLRARERYGKAFREAFGIASTSELTRELVAKAIAQYERSLISAGSRYDRVVHGLDGYFTELEEDGRQLFFTEPSTDHPGCGHCHNAPTFATERFVNNGIDAAEDLSDFVDGGRGEVTGDAYDNGKFRAPTLRNIDLTAPYMHDGRFATLDEVLEHYASGGHYSPSRDPQITGFPLTDRDRDALKAFLATLTDTAVAAF